STSSSARKVSASFLRCSAENTSSFSEWSWRRENCLVTCSTRTISRAVGTAAEVGTSCGFGLITAPPSQVLREAPPGALEDDGAEGEDRPGDQQPGPPQAEGLSGSHQRGIARDRLHDLRGVAPESDVEQLD